MRPLSTVSLATGCPPAPFPGPGRISSTALGNTRPVPKDKDLSCYVQRDGGRISGHDLHPSPPPRDTRTYVNKYIHKCIHRAASLSLTCSLSLKLWHRTLLDLSPRAPKNLQLQRGGEGDSPLTSIPVLGCWVGSLPAPHKRPGAASPARLALLWPAGPAQESQDPCKDLRQRRRSTAKDKTGHNTFSNKPQPPEGLAPAYLCGAGLAGRLLLCHPDPGM